MHGNYDEAVIRLKELEAENATLTSTVTALEAQCVEFRMALYEILAMNKNGEAINETGRIARDLLESTTAGDDLLAQLAAAVIKRDDVKQSADCVDEQYEAALDVIEKQAIQIIGLTASLEIAHRQYPSEILILQTQLAEAQSFFEFLKQTAPATYQMWQRQYIKDKIAAISQSESKQEKA